MKTYFDLKQNCRNNGYFTPELIDDDNFIEMLWDTLSVIIFPELCAGNVKEIYEEGFGEGFEDGKSEGFEDGYSEGFEDGKSEGYDDGNNDGYSEGYEIGKSEGYGESSGGM